MRIAAWACVVGLLGPGTEVAADERPLVLVYTRNGEGYVHENIAASVAALQGLAQRGGFRVEVSDRPELFSDAGLARFRAIIFSNTNNDAFTSDEQRAAFRRFVEAGGGFVGIHSAAGSERRWPWFTEMLGGSFAWHPPLQPLSIRILDRDHPATSFLGDKTWSWEDEFYFMKALAPGLRVLMAGETGGLKGLDRMPDSVSDKPSPYPLVWCRELGQARVWYTALGHKSEHYQDATYLEHLLGGILWTLRMK